MNHTMINTLLNFVAVGFWLIVFGAMLGIFVAKMRHYKDYNRRDDFKFMGVVLMLLLTVFQVGMCIDFFSRYDFKDPYNSILVTSSENNYDN